MPKLTDTQRVILSAAAKRRDGAALPLPRSLKLKGEALAATLEGLRKKGLLDERSAAADAVAWRESEDGRRLTLVVTDAGRRAVGVEPDRAAPLCGAGPLQNAVHRLAQPACFVAARCAGGRLELHCRARAPRRQALQRHRCGRSLCWP